MQHRSDFDDSTKEFSIHLLLASSWEKTNVSTLAVFQSGVRKSI